MSEPKNIVVSCDLIDPPNDACKIKPDKVDRLVKSIEANGLLQPPGVIAVGNRFRTVYGNHRLHAWLKLGHSEIEVRVLPSDTTQEQELSISLQENHVREDEDFLDTLARVEKRAKQMSCTFKKASEVEHVNPAYVSRAKKIVKNLDERVLRHARQNDVGLSVLYAISAASDVKLQEQLLTAYLDGSMNRAVIAQAVRKQSKRSVKKVNIERATEVATIKIAVQANASYELLFQQISELRKELAKLQKNGIQLKLVPEVMKGGQKDVVLQKA